MISAENEGLVRQILQILFTALATNGLINAEHIQAFTGTGVAIAITIWSYWRGRQQRKALLATQNAAIAAIQIAAKETVNSPRNNIVSIPLAEKVIEEKVAEVIGPEEAALAPLKTNGHEVKAA